MPLVDVELVAAGLVARMSEGQQVLLVEGRHGQAAGESKLHERSAGRSTDTTACTDPTVCTDANASVTPAGSVSAGSAVSSAVPAGTTGTNDAQPASSALALSAAGYRGLAYL